MKVISTYRCLNCGAEKKIEHEVKGRKIFRRKANPSITGVQWDWFNLGWEEPIDGSVSKIGVHTENDGLLRLDPIIGHICNEGENAFGIMQLVHVCNGDKQLTQNEDSCET